MNLPVPAFPDIVIPTPAPNTAVVVAGELRQKVADLVGQMTSLPDITDNDSFQKVRAVVKEASKLKRDVEASRLLANSPFSSIIASINTVAKSVTAQLDAIISEGKLQETQFIVESERKKAEEAERLRQQELIAAADTSRPTAPLQVMYLPEVIDAPIGTRTDIEITAMDSIPDEFWALDMAKLRKAVLVDGREIPGVKKTTVRQVVAR